MTKLSKLQALFQAYLLEGDESLYELVAQPPTASIAVRCGVYGNAYITRLQGILRQDFPKCAVLLGQDTFDEVTRAYLKAHPSRHFSVRYLGVGLAQYLAQTAPYDSKPYLAELARFEWAINDALDSGDAPLTTIEALIEVPEADWPYLQFVFHPSVQAIELHYDSVSYWREVHQGKESVAESIAPLPSEATCLIWRQGIQAYQSILNDEEAVIYRSLSQGECFAECCEALSDRLSEEEIPMIVIAALQKWFAQGLISALTKNQDSQ